MKYLLFSLLVGFSSPIFGQTQPDKISLQVLKQQTNTLQQQYKSLKSDLDVIDGFRMVKIFAMDKLWAGVEDSLAIQKSKLKESHKVITDQKKELQRLAAALTASEKAHGDLTSRVNSITAFGILFTKTGFVAMVTVIFFVVLATMGVLIFFARESSHTTRELRMLNDSLYQEFDTYKRHAVEREVKILRELQDCRNKLAELRMV